LLKKESAAAADVFVKVLVAGQTLKKASEGD